MSIVVFYQDQKYYPVFQCNMCLDLIEKADEAYAYTVEIGAEDGACRLPVGFMHHSCYRHREGAKVILLSTFAAALQTNSDNWQPVGKPTKKDLETAENEGYDNARTHGIVHSSYHQVDEAELHAAYMRGVERWQKEEGEV